MTFQQIVDKHMTYHHNHMFWLQTDRQIESKTIRIKDVTHKTLNERVENATR
jgi:hypothetical protein